MEQKIRNNEAMQARVPVEHPFLVMTSMLIGAFVGMFSETSLNIALPKLMGSLNVGTGTIQWLVTGYMLVIGIVLPFSSLISKWFTTRQIIIFGLLAFLVGAIISAMSVSFGMLLFGRMIQGIATGLILPMMFTVAMLIFPPYKLGAIMGMCALVIMFAPALGPTVTGIVLAKLSWQWVFWIFVPLLLVALFFAIFYLKDVGEVTKPKVDVISLFESVIGFSSVVIGVSFASEKGWTSPIVVGTLILGVLVLFIYVKRQLTLEVPVLNLKIFSISEFRVGATIMMLDFAIILSAMYLLPMYIQKGLLLPVALTGIIMFPGGLVNALMSGVAGRLYDRVGAKMPVRLGLVIALIGIIMMAMMSTKTSVAYIIIAHIVLMVGCTLAMSPAQTYALNALTGAQSGDGSTIMNTMQQIIGAIATALATSLLGMGQLAYQNQHGSHALNAAFTNGVHYGFYFTMVLVVVALLFSRKISYPKK